MKRYETIKIERDGLVLKLLLNRPEKHNALNPQLMNEVIHFFETIENDNSIRLVVIKGNGKSFCAGADLAWMQQSVKLGKKENLAECELLSSFFSTIYNSSKITIASIHGNVFGGGNGLAAVCDLAYTVNNSCYSLSETRIGIVAATITPYMLNRLSQLIYKELIFTARQFSGTEAAEIGLVNQSYESVELLDAGLNKTITDILNAGPQSLIGSKLLINKLIDPNKSEKAKRNIPSILANVRVSDESREGFAAFLEKRKPNWTS